MNTVLSRLYIGTLIGIGAAIWVLVLLILGNSLTWDFVAPYGIVVTTLGLIVGAFDRWAWRWRLFQGWFVNRPDLRGSWLVEIDSDWIDPATDKQIEPMIGYMVVRQTFTTLSMRLMTRESSSWLHAHRITKTDDDVFQVMGIFENMPDVHLRGDRSEIHYGSLWLQVLGDPPNSLKGHYWTDRKTRGSLNLTHRKSILYSTHEEASCGYGQGDTGGDVH